MGIDTEEELNTESYQNTLAIQNWKHPITMIILNGKSITDELEVSLTGAPKDAENNEVAVVSVEADYDLS